MIHSATPSTPSNPPRRHYGPKLTIVFLLFCGAGIWGIQNRIQAASNLEHQTNEQAIPTVEVMPIPAGAAQEKIVLPGSLQAWHEAPIYARTNGYLKSWATDIGSPVKAGDVLAEIETPEIDAQLRQAEADLATAEANDRLAQSTNDRWQALLKTRAVSKQDADEKAGDVAAKDAIVASARANRDHLKELEGFKTIVAPFDGTITARNTDTGALINAGGGNGQGMELFHIAETDKLRLYVQVPEANAKDITPDMSAELHVTEYPQRVFTAKLTRTADALDNNTRSLLAEFEVDNDKGELLPGSYAEVHMDLATDGGGIHVPANTLLFRADGLRVAVVDDQNKVQMKTITIGRDYGKEVEVTSGLSKGQRIIVNPPDSIGDGQEVKIAAPAPAADGKKS